MGEAFTAHPRVDPLTGETHAITYVPGHEKVQYQVVTTEGRVRRIIDVPLPGHVMVYDMCLTPKYAVIMDMPVRFSQTAAMSGDPLPLRWDPGHGSRVGLLPREGRAEDVVGCELPGTPFVFHTGNAYGTTDGTVVMEVVRYESMFRTNSLSAFDDEARLYRWTVNPATRRVTELLTAVSGGLLMVATGATPYPHCTAPGSTQPGDPAAGDPRAGAGRGGRMPPVVYVLGGVIFLMGTTEFMVAGPAGAGSVRRRARGGGAQLLLLAPAGRPVRDGDRGGAFWAVGAAVAAGAAGPLARARAMGVMVGGLTLANVIGVPLGTAFGEALGWRGPFWILAGLAVAMMPMIAWRVPAGGGRGHLSVRAEIAVLRTGRVWVVLLAAALFEAGVIAAYSYVSPLLTTRAELPEKFISLVLLGFGAAALLGTITGARLGDRRPFAVAAQALHAASGADAGARADHVGIQHRRSRRVLARRPGPVHQPGPARSRTDRSCPHAGLARAAYPARRRPSPDPGP